MGASASTLLPSAEFICLRVAIARSSGKNCALAAHGGSRNLRRHVLVHPASRASFIAFLSGQETEKEALHKSALAFEVTVAPNLGLVIPVYSRQTGFSSASINFYEKPMVETEPTANK